MKTSIYPYAILLLIGAFLTGCATAPSSAPVQEETPQATPEDEEVPFVYEIVGADAIVGLSLRGTEEWPEDRIEFRADGDLVITLERETYLGTWRYDASRVDFPLTLGWADGTPPEEYVARLALIDDMQYALEARWYYVDPRIRMYRRYVAE